MLTHLSIQHLISRSKKLTFLAIPRKEGTVWAIECKLQSNKENTENSSIYRTCQIKVCALVCAKIFAKIYSGQSR